MSDKQTKLHLISTLSEGRAKVDSTQGDSSIEVFKDWITKNAKNVFLLKSDMGININTTNKCDKELKFGLTSGHLFGLSLNTIMHVAILFLIISLFFFLYISHVEESALNGEIVDNVNKSLPTTLQDLNNKYNNSLYEATRNLPYDELIKMYSQPYPENTLNNNWLKKAVALINILLWTIVIMLIITSLIYTESGCRMSRAKDILNIFLENFVVFICVGALELLFFEYIASKYIPAPPSVLVNSLYSSLQNNLKPQ
jgi:hypothetical protein